MGTPDFAVPCLEVLVEAGHELLMVVTQPDRPKGRGNQVMAPPVKVRAVELGLAVEQPLKIKTSEFTTRLRELAPDLLVVVAFGQLLSQEILDIPRFGCVNVHASLLPKYRGAAPIHWAIINGEQETGITTMYMDIGLDTGDMILKDSLSIGPEDTVGQVHDALAAMGAHLLRETVELIAQGRAPRIAQDDELATYSPKIAREQEIIDWTKDASAIVNHIRGMNPWPGAFTTHEDKVLKLWRAVVWEAHKQQTQSGEIIQVYPKRGFVVQAGRGQVMVEEVQPAGGKRMPARNWVGGARVTEGQLLGQ